MKVELALLLHCSPREVEAFSDVELATLADVLQKRAKRR